MRNSAKTPDQESSAETGERDAEVSVLDKRDGERGGKQREIIIRFFTGATASDVLVREASRGVVKLYNEKYVSTRNNRAGNVIGEG